MWGWEELALGVRRLWREMPPYPTMLETELPSLILYGRLLSAAAGTATVALLYAVGRRVGGARLGMVAAALLAGNYLHVRDSHALKPDVLLAAGVLVSLWLLARYAAAPDRRSAAVAGLSIGLTMAIKYNGILLLAAAYLAGVLASPHAGARRLVPAVEVVLCAGVALATFVVASPYLVLDLERTRQTFRFSTMAVYAARPALGRAFGYHLAVSLRRGSGLAMTLATPLALVVALRSRAPMLVLAAAFSALYFVVIGASPVHLARYLTPLVPLLALLVAHLLLATTGRARPLVVGVLAGALLAEPVLSTIAYDRIVARTDTRVLATQWMAAHLPAGAVVAVLGSLYFPVADPDLPPGVTRASLAPGETDLASHGVTHVVTHWHHQLTAFSQPPLAQMAALLPHLRLLAEFSPFAGVPAGAFEQEDAYYVPFFHFDGVERPGPFVRVYAYEPRP